MARDYLLKYFKEMKTKCHMKKQMIVRNKSDFKVRNQGRLNPYLFPKAGEMEEKYKDYDGSEVSEMCFDAEGNLKELYSGEMSRAEETVVDTYRPDRFEFPFIKIPFFGERGLVVRDLTDSDTKSYRSYGVLDTNTEEWNSFLQRMEDWEKRKNRMVDRAETIKDIMF